MPAFLCRYSKTLTLAPGVAQDVDVPIDGARAWCVVVKNTGPTNDVTALSLYRLPLGNLAGPATAVTAGIPLASGASLEVRGENEPLTTLRLTLTSTSGTTVSLEAAGW